MMLTTTTNNTNTTNSNTTAQQQRTTKMRTPEQEERLRNRWEDRVTDALFRQLKRKVRAANALFGTLEWVSIDQTPTWFMLHLKKNVTRHAALAEECLDDDARARQAQGARAPPPRVPTVLYPRVRGDGALSEALEVRQRRGCRGGRGRAHARALRVSPDGLKIKKSVWLSHDDMM
jgi:hypothetical protein